MSSISTAVERYQPVLTEVEQSTLLGFLAGYRGFTREAYTLDLRQFTTWCWQHDRRLFDVHRVDIECFARHLEDAGRARATVARPVEHDRRVLPVRGRGGRHRAFAGGPRSPAADRLRVPRRTLGPQRTRRDLGGCWVGLGQGSRPRLAVSAERAAGLRGDRSEHRSPRSRAWSSHPAGAAQGRQDRDGAAGPASRPGDRLGHR